MFVVRDEYLLAGSFVRRGASRGFQWEPNFLLSADRLPSPQGTPLSNIAQWHKNPHTSLGGTTGNCAALLMTAAIHGQRLNVLAEHVSPADLPGSQVFFAPSA
jgi:hypothetical protein